MNSILYSLSGCAFVADLVQTALAASELRLFKSTLEPTPETPLADFDSAECDFSGYTTGGETIATWLDPILAPTSGYQITSPIVQWAADNPTTVGNVVGGWYLVESGGELIAYGTYGTPQPMEVPGQGLDVSITLVFPTGQ